MRNFDFFGAPQVGVVCMHHDLGPPDALSVGMYLQTLLLGLTERGLGTCVEVSVVGYPETLRKELGIAEELQILCGVAIGYADPRLPGEISCTFIASPLKRILHSTTAKFHSSIALTICPDKNRAKQLQY